MANMLLKTITVQNFCGFESLEANFSSGVNVIAGINGAGKTSLLKAISIAASQIWHQASRFSCPELRLASDFIRKSNEKYENGFRFEEQLPCYVKGIFINNSQEYEANACINLEVEKKIPKSRVSPSVKTWEENLPLLACYWAARSWNQPKDVSAVAAATAKEPRVSGYASALDASADVKSFVAWIVTRTFERLQSIAVEHKTAEDLDHDELGILNRALEKALPNEFAGISFDVKQRSIFVEFKRDGRINKTAFENLSEGEKSFICLIADIARRICVLNPQLGARVLEETQGLVLIDELDLHLHPAWQRRIIRSLQETFPKVQFIVTTHSPQILGEVAPDQVLLLSRGHISRPLQSFGLSSDEILRDLMGTADMSTDISQLVDRAYAYLDAEKFQDARKTIAEIQKLTRGDTEETVSLETFVNTLDDISSEE